MELKETNYIFGIGILLSIKIYQILFLKFKKKIFFCSCHISPNWRSFDKCHFKILFLRIRLELGKTNYRFGISIDVAKFLKKKIFLPPKIGGGRSPHFRFFEWSYLRNYLEFWKTNCWFGTRRKFAIRIF